MLSLHDALPICPWRDLTYFCIGSLTIEERRQSLRDLIAHYRQHLVATGATNVIDLDEIWEQVRRWVMYGIQAWAANRDHWGQNGLPMNERFFAAGEDRGTWKLLLGEIGRASCRGRVCKDG